MSIQIKCMEMPRKCSDCLVLVYGRCLVNDDKDVSKAMADAVRDEDCPLVPVPPHGRLIESVELYGRAEDIKTKAMSVCDKPQSWQFGVFWAIEQIEAALTNAPTIIPAELPKEES